MPADGKLPPDESKLAAVPYPHPLLQSETKGSPFAVTVARMDFVRAAPRD